MWILHFHKNKVRSWIPRALHWFTVILVVVRQDCQCGVEDVEQVLRRRLCLGR